LTIESERGNIVMSNATFRSLLQTKDLKIGIFLAEFATAGIGRILSATGCQFAFLDMEHAAFGYETLKKTMRLLHDAGVATMVRPPTQAGHHIARVCDVGAQGVMPPMVGTAEQAEQIVGHMKYVPDGTRGVALGLAHDDYAPGSVKDKFAQANQKTCMIALIETVEGVENADAIAAVDGVDCLWVGHFDLSCSLGIPGQFDHPDFQAAMAAVVAAGKAHNKSLGRVAPTVADGVELYAQGFDFIINSADIKLLQNALSADIATLREKCPPR
jgi:2-keto-3-deoxy-L-rhamnonate aldolase RhmA